MLGIALPYADAWNTWYDDYGNTVEGFAALNSRISEAAQEAGRNPGDVERSACVLVTLEGAREREPDPDAPAVVPQGLAEHLQGLSGAGADEAIIVADPITERSIELLGQALGS